MSISSSLSANPEVVGFDAGWELQFLHGQSGLPMTSDPDKLTVSRESYYGTITISRTAAFRAGQFSIAIDGLTDAEYGRLIDTDDRLPFVRIAIGWRDLGSGFTAALATYASLFAGTGDERYTFVMMGRIQRINRVAGTHRYRTEISGVDFQFHRLNHLQATALGDIRDEPISGYLERLCDQAGITQTFHPAGSTGSVLADPIQVEGRTIANCLSELALRSHIDGPNRDTPYFLRNDGLHFGRWQAPVVEGAEEKVLAASQGLVEARPVLEERQDSTTSSDPLATTDPTTMQHDATLYGRPDIQIGDLVKLEVDDPADLSRTLPESVMGGLGDMVMGVGEAFSGGSAESPDYTSFAVVSVEHQLSRRQGFVTRLRLEPQPSTEQDSDDPRIAAQREINEQDRIAALLQQQRRSRAAAQQVMEVGEINRQSISSGNNRAAQRIDVQAGLQPLEQPNRPVKAARSQNPYQLVNKPYLTPFAFGKTGLVIPHYPGMRVLSHHYQGLGSDAVVGGCLWPEGQEPASQLGDWWLSLPVGVSSNEQVDDPSEATLPSNQTKASHDLIDGDGKRVIHVKGFKINVGNSLLPNAGTRPGDATAEVLEITHAGNNAKIKIDSSGNIEISTDGDMKLKAGGTMNLEANNVVATVTQDFEVK